jgi:hypothetical protein
MSARILLVVVLLWMSQDRELSPAPVYDVKAAFLYNFATFVEWPPATFADPQAPFAVGVFGKDPFGPSLEDTFRGKTVGGRRIVVRRSSDAGDLLSCQLVFVPCGEGERGAAALTAFKGIRVLTVGERDGFARDGGCVNFYIDDRRVRFEINPEAAKRANLKISSKLLRLARVVTENK